MAPLATALPSDAGNFCLLDYGDSYFRNPLPRRKDFESQPRKRPFNIQKSNAPIKQDFSLLTL